MAYIIEVPDDVHKILKKLEEEGKIPSKPEFIWNLIREKLK
jgi:hypothetical protein